MTSAHEIHDSPSPTSALDAALRRAPNPFEGSVLRSAHEDVSSDVPAMQGETFAALTALVERVRGDHHSRIQVVTGDPGEGKTHLLSRLRRRAEKSWLTAAPFALAVVRPLRDPAQPFGHVLREATFSLGRPLPFLDPEGEQPASQLERLAWMALGRAVHHLSERDPSLRTWGAKNAAHGLATFAALAIEGWPERGLSIVEGAAPWADRRGIDADVWRAVGRLPVQGARHATLAWLKGMHLPEPELERFGLPAPIASEDRAYRALISLANLAGVPLVLGFDQLEGIRRQGTEQVRQFFAALVELYNHEAGNLALMVLCQTSVWPEIRGELEQQILDRLEPERMLRPLSPDEVHALCARRLAPLWNGEDLTPPHPTYPISPSDLDAIAAEAQTARRVLNRIREQLERWKTAGSAEGKAPPELPAMAPEERARRLYEEALAQEAPALLEQTPELRDAMSRNALRLALDGARRRGRPVAGAEVVEIHDLPLHGHNDGATRITLARGDERRRVYLEANSSTHGQSAAASVKRLRGQVEGTKAAADVALLLRDRGRPLPATALKLIEQAKRVTVVWLDGEDLPPLAALEAFLNAAAENEIAADTAMALAAEIAGELGATGKLVEAAFGDPRSPAAAPDPALARRIEQYLTENRSIVGQLQLSQALGVETQPLAVALEALAAEGKVSLTADRNQAPIVVRRA